MRNILLLIFAAVFGVLIALGARKLFPGDRHVNAIVAPGVNKEGSKPGIELSKIPTPASSTPAPSFQVLPPQPVDTTAQKPLTVLGVAWLTERVPVFNRAGERVKELVSPKGLRVLLSDGRTITDADGIIDGVDSTGVRFKDGTRLWMVAARRAVPPPVAAIAPAVAPASKPADVAPVPAIVAAQ